jgi:hypothetical protein
MKTDESGKLGALLSGLAKIHKEAHGQHNLIRLKYLYYTDFDLKGEDLVEDLKKLNYTGEVDASGRKSDYTRVYGESALLVNTEKNISEWVSEMKNIGSNRGCEFVCLSVIHQPLLRVDEVLEKHQVVSTAQFEERTKDHVGSLDIYREMREIHGDQSEFMKLDYWFYTDLREKAETLADALRNLKYEVQISDGGHEDKQICISGCTPFMHDVDDAMEKWVTQMNELGFIHDCEFDGWGSPVENGGWFSDDTPDEEVRRRLGLPPMEDEKS